MMRFRAFLILLASVALFFHQTALADRGQAALALNEGRADDATRLLQAEIASAPTDPIAHQLLCRVFYSQDLASAAIQECEAAVANSTPEAGRNREVSNNYLWLGRAYGLKASIVNPILAFALARKVDAAFERAVALDPQNVAALRDLGEFYVAAPAIVGGGLDKAHQLAARMMPVSTTKAHRLLAQIAEKNGDDATAELEFKRAVETQRSPEAYVDLGDFYRRRHQGDQSFAAVEMAIRLDTAKDASIVDAASILTGIDRSPRLAEDLLNQYLASPARSDGAPAARVHVQLGDLLLKAGDRERARQEYQAALLLASKYTPARKALQSL
jgi:tetratricopeptide (TPR) repeat protein